MLIRTKFPINGFIKRTHRSTPKHTRSNRPFQSCKDKYTDLSQTENNERSFDS